MSLPFPLHISPTFLFPKFFIYATVYIKAISDHKGGLYMYRILFVADDHFLRKKIIQMLCQQGYEVLEADSKLQASHMILSDSNIDLYLLDVMLSDGDGFSLCRLIREHSNHPILFLTACDDEESVVTGLKLGADDYITKPFREAVLLARIETNLRRLSNAALTDYLQAGDAKLDLTNNQLYIADTPIVLAPVEYEIVHILMQQTGMIVRREIFQECIWEFDGGVDDNTLTVHISRIRRKIGATRIETIKGFGYRWRV